MNEQQQVLNPPEQFPTKDEIDDAIKNRVDNMFDDTEVLSDNVIKTLFSKEIEDWKKITNQKQDLDRKQMQGIITKSLQNRTNKFIGELKNNKMINVEKVELKCSDKGILYLSINDGKSVIKLFKFYHMKAVSHVPQTPRPVRTENGQEYINFIQKEIDKYNTVSIIDCMHNLIYNDQKEHDDNKHKQDDVNMTFHKNKKGEIYEITLVRYYSTIDGNIFLPKIEITLQNGNITEIRLKDSNDNITSTLTMETNKVDIENKIKEIFSNNDDIAIQNILHELNEEQLRAITNNHTIDISIEKKEEEKEENKDININDKSNNIINNETNNQNQNNNGKSGIANNECSQCLKNIWPFSLCCN